MRVVCLVSKSRGYVPRRSVSHDAGGSAELDGPPLHANSGRRGPRSIAMARSHLCAGTFAVRRRRPSYSVQEHPPPPSNTRQFHLSSMGNSLVTPSSRSPGSALPSGATNGQAESSMSNWEAPSHVPALKSRALGPMGVAESRDSVPTVTPRQVQIADSPSRSKASAVARALLLTGLRC